MIGDPSTKVAINMGDKSPKAKDKQKKQQDLGKGQKKAAAVAKAGAQGSANSKKGK
jgi:hypothetical protein